MSNIEGFADSHSLASAMDALQVAWSELSVPDMDLADDLVERAEHDEGETARHRFGRKRWDEVAVDDVSVGYATLLFLPTRAHLYYCGTYLYHGLNFLATSARGSDNYWRGRELCDYAFEWMTHFVLAAYSKSQVVALAQVSSCLAAEFEDFEPAARHFSILSHARDS